MQGLNIKQVSLPDSTVSHAEKNVNPTDYIMNIYAESKDSHYRNPRG